MSTATTMANDKNKYDGAIDEFLYYRWSGDNTVDITDTEHVFKSGYQHFSCGYEFEEPHQQISKLQAIYLQGFIRQHNISSILEVGSFVGYSSFVMAQAMVAEGNVISIENNEEFYQIACHNKQTHRDKFKVDCITPKLHYVCDDAKHYLSTPQAMEEAGLIDMFFLDGDKLNYVFYYDWVVSNMRSGSFFIIDNALFKGKVITDTSNSYAGGIRIMIDKLHEEGKFEYNFVPIGDCMIVAKKK